MHHGVIGRGVPGVSGIWVISVMYIQKRKEQRDSVPGDGASLDTVKNHYYSLALRH